MEKIRLAAKKYVDEINEFGISSDTMATERLYALSRAMIESGDASLKVMGEKMWSLDADGVHRRKAVVYALVTIGAIFGNDLCDNCSKRKTADLSILPPKRAR